MLCDGIIGERAGDWHLGEYRVPLMVQLGCLVFTLRSIQARFSRGEAMMRKVFAFIEECRGKQVALG